MKILKTLTVALFALASLQSNAAVFEETGDIQNKFAGPASSTNGAAIGTLEFTVAVAGNVSITSDGRGFNSFIYLFDSNGIALAFNDNAPGVGIFEESYYDSAILDYYLDEGSYTVTIGHGLHSAEAAWVDGFISGVDAAGIIASDGYTERTWDLKVVTPVPVPAALPLFFSALAGLGLLRRRNP